MHPCKEGDIVRDMASGCNGVVTRDTQIGLVFVTFFEDGKWQKEVAFEPWLLDYPEYSCTAEKELLVAASNQIRKSWNSLRMLHEYSNAIVHAFQKFRAPFSGKIVHIFPEQSAAFN